MIFIVFVNIVVFSFTDDRQLIINWYNFQVLIYKTTFFISLHALPMMHPMNMYCYHKTKVNIGNPNMSNMFSVLTIVWLSYFSLFNHIRLYSLSGNPMDNNRHSK